MRPTLWTFVRSAATVLAVLVLLANVWFLAQAREAPTSSAVCPENRADPSLARIDVDQLAERVAFLLKQDGTVARAAVAQTAVVPQTADTQAIDASAADTARVSEAPADEPSPEQYAAALEAAAIVERSIGRGVLMADEARQLRELQRQASPREFSPILRQLLIALNRQQLRFESPEAQFP